MVRWRIIALCIAITLWFGDQASGQSLPSSCTFTDSPLVTGGTTIKAAHITQLRACISDLRAQRFLSSVSWTDSTMTAGQTVVKAVHVNELRSALAGVFGGQPAPVYSDPPATGAAIRATHLMEIRSAVNALRCSYSISPTALSTSSANYFGTLSITTSSGCKWTASADGFIQITSSSSGTGSGTVSFHVDNNTANESRQGAIIAAGRVVSVTQAAVGAEGCNYSVSPTSATVGAGPESGVIRVTTASGCNWSAASSSTFIVINDPSGTGTGSVEYQIDPNSSTTSRTASMTVAGVTVSITQSGTHATTNQPTPTCEFNLSDDSISFPVAGGTQLIRMDVSGECAWEAASEASWISLSGATSGYGSASFSVTVPQNTGPSHSGTLIIGSRTVEVFQQGDESPSPPPWHDQVTVGITQSGAIIYGPYASWRWEGWPESQYVDGCRGNCGAGCSSTNNPCGGRTQYWELQIVEPPVVVAANADAEEVKCFGDPYSCYVYTMQRHYTIGRWVYHGYFTSSCKSHDDICPEFLWGAGCAWFTGCGSGEPRDWSYDTYVFGWKILSIERLDP